MWKEDLRKTLHSNKLLKPKKEHLYLHKHTHLPPFPLDTTDCFVLPCYKYLFMQNYIKSCPTLKHKILSNTASFKRLKIKSSTKTRQKARKKKKSSPTPFPSSNENKSNIKTSSSQSLRVYTLVRRSLWYAMPSHSLRKKRITKEKNVFLNVINSHHLPLKWRVLFKNSHFWF